MIIRQINLGNLNEKCPKIYFLDCYNWLSSEKKISIKEFPNSFYMQFVSKDSAIDKYKMYLIIGDKENPETEVYKIAKELSTRVDSTLKNFQLVFYNANDELEYNFGKDTSSPDKFPGDWFSLFGENLSYEFTWQY
jgi:hypothetical protein